MAIKQLLIITFIAGSQAWAETPSTSATKVQSGASIESQSVPAMRYYENTEIFSESNYTGDVDGAATQTRVRLSRPLGQANLRGYAGVQFDQNFSSAPNRNVLVFDDAISPHAGVLYKPLPFLTTFAEYRQRMRAASEEKSALNQSDPRIGQSALYMFRPPTATFNAEVFEETVWITRLPSAVLIGAWARGFVRKTTASFGNFDLYSEINEYKAPEGPNKNKISSQLRAGGRWTKEWKQWKGGLFVYQPWLFTQGLNLDSGHDVEGLLVIAGTY